LLLCVGLRNPHYKNKAKKRNETADSLRIPNSLMLTKKERKKEKQTKQKTKTKNKKTFQISNTTKIIK
jgi:hypothetical protein